MQPLIIRYAFVFHDGRRIEHPVVLDPQTLTPSGPPPDPAPEWTRLEHHCCPGCRLDPAEHTYCPAALRLVRPAEAFADILSYEQVRVEVETAERRVTQETTTQAAVSSLLGLLMATSGCPETAPFKPMARFHLPLASEAETIYRAASMYLLGQYFRHRDGLGVDLDLNGLVRTYQRLAMVNRGMARRLREASRRDSTVNAVVLLDLFTKSLPAAVEGALAELRPLYSAYLPERPG